MTKKNKIKAAISSIIILLPTLFGIIMWNDLPDIMMTHWGADGNADGFGGKVFVVFGLPAILLAAHLICFMFTLLDKKQKEQCSKVQGMIFWIMPMISLFASGMTYRAAFGKEVGGELLVPLLGAMFIFIGNYLPKIKQNRTFGIKTFWALSNEENWNKTHRLSGKLWVIGGFIMVFTIFLPPAAMTWIMVCVIIAMMIIPIVYSYFIYRQHRKEKISYAHTPKSKAEKLIVKISTIVGVVIVIGAAVLMVTGNIEVSCEDTSFTIHADYWTDLEVDYSEIDAIECRGDLDVGVRTNGFGSPRLSMGIFQNDEFGSYTLYAYTGAKEYIVLRSEAKTLVIGMKDAEATQTIYHTMLEKIGE